MSDREGRAMRLYKPAVRGMGNGLGSCDELAGAQKGCSKSLKPRLVTTGAPNVGLIGYLGKVKEEVEFLDKFVQRCEAFLSSRTLTTERKSTPKTEFNKSKTQNANQIGIFAQNSKTPKPEEFLKRADFKSAGGNVGLVKHDVTNCGAVLHVKYVGRGDAGSVAVGATGEVLGDPLDKHVRREHVNVGCTVTVAACQTDHRTSNEEQKCTSTTNSLRFDEKRKSPIFKAVSQGDKRLKHFSSRVFDAIMSSDTRSVTQDSDTVAAQTGIAQSGQRSCSVSSQSDVEVHGYAAPARLQFNNSDEEILFSRPTDRRPATDMSSTLPMDTPILQQRIVDRADVTENTGRLNVASVAQNVGGFNYVSVAERDGEPGYASQMDFVSVSGASAGMMNRDSDCSQPRFHGIVLHGDAQQYAHRYDVPKAHYYS